jgi:glycosyltransferase involved in cell wall biosynthesis
VPDPSVRRLPNQVLFVGRLVEKKGVKYLLQALKEVSKQLPDTTLVIAGSGPLQSELESITQDLGLTQQVKFAGRLEHKELVRLYQESTVAVFPFVQAKDGDMEGLGLVMVEAMGCGCPVIASDLPAVRDVIMHEEDGYLVESGNISALSRAVLTYLHNPVSPICIPFAFDWKIIATCYQQTLLHHAPMTPIL